MPSLRTTLHTDMLRSRTLPRRVYHAVRRELVSKGPYGVEWGDPEVVPPLQFTRERWIAPYVNGQQTALEIGPGGGRWTRYLLEFQQLFVVDYHEDLLAELRRTVDKPNLVYIHNNGTDFPGVPDQAVDYLFSFGTFVHLDADIIRAYLENMKRVLKPTANAVIHYSDKTKIMAQVNPSFADNDPVRMRAMVTEAGFQIFDEDLTSLWHSSMIRFGVHPDEAGSRSAGLRS